MLFVNIKPYSNMLFLQAAWDTWGQAPFIPFVPLYFSQSIKTFGHLSIALSGISFTLAGKRR